MVSTTAEHPQMPCLVDLLDLARSVPEGRPVWAHQSTDLNVNLISLTSGQGIPSHVNTEVDVLFVGIDGAGSVDIDDHRHPVRAGQAVVIPKGSWRAIRCDGEQFAYLTCHRRRTGLLPVAPRPHGESGKRGEDHGDANPSSE